MKENDRQGIIPKDISGIYQQILEVLIQARSRAFQAVNTEMVLLLADWSPDRRGRAEGEGTGEIREIPDKRIVRAPNQGIWKGFLFIKY